jgi:hypothetical protein
MSFKQTAEQLIKNKWPLLVTIALGIYFAVNFIRTLIHAIGSHKGMIWFQIIGMTCSVLFASCLLYFVYIFLSKLRNKS